MGLKQRGNQHWFKLAIPKPLQRYFLSSKGKPLHHIEEPLGDSLSVAKVKAAQRHAVCVELFARLRAGEQMTPEQIKVALHGPSAHQAIDSALQRYVSELRDAQERARLEHKAAPWLAHGAAFGSAALIGQSEPAPSGETISQAADAWFAKMERDAESQPLTIAGHRNRARAFIDKHGNMPLIDVTRAIASDFVDGLNVSQRTRKQYRTSLKCLFESAKDRGRFTGDNPFEKKGKRIQGESYKPFTVPELQTLFDALPCEIAPKKHTPETALPWVARIALYTGMRLEEIAQLTVADIRECPANGATITVINIHNGGTNKLKNETSARLVPVHSELVRVGFLDYVKTVKAGPLFPGLKRRASKGGKVGARLGELFRKTLVRLGLKRDGLCFHSLRHNVAGRLDAAEVRQSDAARVLGHAVEGMSYGEYSKAGPGLKIVSATVEKISYEGLRL
jgi:integrase